MEKSIHSKAASILRKVFQKPKPALTPGEEQPPAEIAPKEKPAETTN